MQVFNKTPETKTDLKAGYATYAAAQARGQEVEAMVTDCQFRWVVMALPTGRFAPMIIVNQNVPGGPGRFLGMRNVYLSN